MLERFSECSHGPHCSAPVLTAITSLGQVTSTVTVLPVGLPAAGWELLGAGVPVVDARLLIAAQYTADFFRDLLATRRLRLQQPGEHLAQLRHR